MDPDELFVLLGSLSITCVAGFKWYDRLTNASPAGRATTPGVRLALGALPLALLVRLGWALNVGAAKEVRDDFSYMLLFLALGATWLALSWRATAWLGIDVVDDALERNNLAACVAACGAGVGSMTIYMYANVGEGPTIWTTIGPALLGTLTAAALTAAFQLSAGAADAITIDRDLASGIRFAGLTIGGGYMLGRPLAGDYESASSTLSDFFSDAWPALPLLAVAILAERRLRASRQDPRPNALLKGLLPALAYVAVGILDVIHLGPLKVVQGH